MIQDYQPAGPLWLSAIVAGLPVIALLVTLGVLRRSAHLSAALALVTALLVAIFVYPMPVGLAFDAAAMGIAFGVWNVIWIAFHAVYFHNVTVATGRFDTVKSVLAGFSPDRRLQALLIAFRGVAGGDRGRRGAGGDHGCDAVRARFPAGQGDCAGVAGQYRAGGSRCRPA